MGTIAMGTIAFLLFSPKLTLEKWLTSNLASFFEKEVIERNKYLFFSNVTVTRLPAKDPIYRSTVYFIDQIHERGLKGLQLWFFRA